MSEITYKVKPKHMTGNGILSFQETLNSQMDTWGINYNVPEDDDWGVRSRDLCATVLYGLGISRKEMAEGVTPELRTKVRNKDLSDEERRLYHDRHDWRLRLRRKYAGEALSSPLAVILQHSWGWHPPGHDGVDLICGVNAHGLAICKARVIRSANSGWANPAFGDDGIVILRSQVNAGPIRKGMNLCYGHAEQVRVSEGDLVKPGQWICNAGKAGGAWHFHFMVNNDDHDKGVGDRDPWPIVNYARKH